MACQVFQVGPDNYDPPVSMQKGMRWIVYWYQQGDYDGNGEAVGLSDDGKVCVAGLGHCSCYGAWEQDFGVEGWDREDIDPFEFLANIDFKPEHDEVDAKVRELL